MYLTVSLLNIFLFQEEGTHKADWLNNDTQDTKIYFGRSFLSCAVISRSFTMKSKFEWSCGVFILDRPSFAFAFVSMSPKWLLKCSSVIFPFSNMTVSLANHMLWYINIEHTKQCNYLVLIFTLNTTSKWFLSLWFEQLTNIQLSTMNMVNNFCSNISSVFFFVTLILECSFGSQNVLGKNCKNCSHPPFLFNLFKSLYSSLKFWLQCFWDSIAILLKVQFLV